MDVDAFLKDNNGSYVVTVDDDESSHRVLVMPTQNGRGYCPVDLIAKGDMNQAARVAKRAFDLGL